MGPHPLEPWLKKSGLNINSFAKTAGIPFRALYSHCRGESDPKLSTMLAIEEKTGGAVTAEKQVKWWRKWL